MTHDEGTPTAPEQDQTHGCEHCDDSTPHSHVDEGALVEDYRAALRRARTTTAVVTLLGLAVVAVVALDSALGVLLGALAWVLATGAGVLVWVLLRRRTTEKVAVLVGAVVSAASAPLLALAVAALVPGPGWARGLAAAFGWMAVSAGTSGHRAGVLRALLVQDSRAGEAARSAVVRTNGRPSPVAEAVWLVVTALVLGGFVAAAAGLPVLVAVLVPLNVALAMLTRRWQARAAEPAASQPRAAS